MFNQDEEEDEKEEQARKKKLTMPTDDDKLVRIEEYMYYLFTVSCSPNK